MDTPGSTKRLVLLGTNRHAIAIDDFYMLFSRSRHEIVRIQYPAGSHRQRDWWEKGERLDPARESIVDPIDKASTSILVWNEPVEVLDDLADLEWDYVCVGNGNDPAQKLVAERFGRERMLFSEYGWLPWASHFYISRLGTGVDSELTEMTRSELDSVGVRSREMRALRRTFRGGRTPPDQPFVYVPLQKDVNDFKFLSSPFESNEEFLAHLYDIIPRELLVLVKRHPLYEKTYDLSRYENFVDVSDADLDKSRLYRRMEAMVCINSTSVLEAILFERRVIAFGHDIFMNKGLVTFRPDSLEQMRDALGAPVDRAGCRRFISLLLARQVNRARCVSNDLRYVQRHYWVEELSRA